MEGDKIVHKDLSYKIVGVLYEVYNKLGYGYQEKYYQRAIEQEFSLLDINFSRQLPYSIKFKGEIIGRYFLDFLVEDKIVLEIKKGNHYSRRNIEQVLGYLKATNKQLAILANFTANGVKCLRILNVKS